MKSTQYAFTINGIRVFGDETAIAINPATELPICEFPLASKNHLDQAVAAAQQAFIGWSATSLSEREAMVGKLGDVIEQNFEAFINLLITEQGKGRAAAEFEISGSIHWCREIAKQRLAPEILRSNGEEEIVVRRTPIGVVGCITPWNFPLLLAVWKIAPALMAGNTVVLKPSPFTPLCTLWFGELALKVLPPGVLNVLAGSNELGQWMTEHPGIGKIAFTGSTATGRRVMQSASSTLKRLTLELGGNDPAIVLPDVDAKAIAKDLFWASFANSSQFCAACKRLYIHEDVYDDVAHEMAAYASTVKMGNGMQDGVELGPLQNKMQFDKVTDLLADCRAQGFRFFSGGTPAQTPGYFVPVTLIDNPPETSRCVVEEAFGPVLPLLKYRSIDEVVARANNTEYGLAASVWGKDIALAEAVGQRLQAGTVWINQIHVFSPDYPFGGHKQSGLGIENSLHGLSHYTNIQTVIRKAMN